MRVIVVNQSAELRQVLQYVFENGIDVDVVAETDDIRKLPKQISELHPDWLFLLQDEYTSLTRTVDRLLDVDPDLRIILLSADGKHVRYQQSASWGTAVDTWPEYTLSDFIYLLTAEGESPRSVKSIEDVGNIPSCV
jgi:chemotaxis response regulator CheB